MLITMFSEEFLLIKSGKERGINLRFDLYRVMGSGFNLRSFFGDWGRGEEGIHVVRTIAKIIIC